VNPDRWWVSSNVWCIDILPWSPCCRNKHINRPVTSVFIVPTATIHRVVQKNLSAGHCESKNVARCLVTLVDFSRVFAGGCQFICAISQKHAARITEIHIGVFRREFGNAFILRSRSCGHAFLAQKNVSAYLASSSSSSQELHRHGQDVVRS